MPDDYLTDLYLTRRAIGVPSVNLTPVDLEEAKGDFRLVHGRNNLVQAIMNRLITRRGELASLGHPEYGSRLYLLLGEPDIMRTRLRCELYVREALAGENRIAEILDVRFPSKPGVNRGVLEIVVVVRPVGGEPPFAVKVGAPIGG